MGRLHGRHGEQGGRTQCASRGLTHKELGAQEGACDTSADSPQLLGLRQHTLRTRSVAVKVPWLWAGQFLLGLGRAVSRFSLSWAPRQSAGTCTQDPLAVLLSSSLHWGLLQPSDLLFAQLVTHECLVFPGQLAFTTRQAVRGDICSPGQRVLGALAGGWLRTSVTFASALCFLEVGGPCL